MSFRAQLGADLAALGADLPAPLWALITWLEARGQVYHTTHGNRPFLAAMPVAERAALWSDIYFESPPDLVRFWFGKPGLERQVIPFIHCEGDGSMLALWRHAGVDRFVFLGSEGDGFVVAETPEALIALITMGYAWIEGRFALEVPPAEVWAEVFDTPWPDPVEVKTWAGEALGVVYPEMGAKLLPYPPDADPFAAFITRETAQA